MAEYRIVKSEVVVHEEKGILKTHEKTDWSKETLMGAKTHIEPNAWSLWR
jgi:hypothetical protein